MEREELGRLHSAGMAVARVVYFCAKEALSYHAFERALVLQRRNGVNVGTLNHSRKLVPDLVAAMHSVIAKRVAKWLNEPAEELGGRRCEPPALCQLPLAGQASVRARRERAASRSGCAAHTCIAPSPASRTAQAPCRF